jgi:hypothetical protein
LVAQATWLLLQIADVTFEPSGVPPVGDGLADRGGDDRLRGGGSLRLVGGSLVRK